MLSEKSRPVIEATLPVVGEHISEIARRFYSHLFDAHPELLDGTFNRGNQAEGTQQQALAGSVAAFARVLLENPGHAPEQLLARIAHKHASLGITPEQYDVVHEHLFRAIVDVLGDAVTPEVAAAWTEVYWLMAHALIALERGLYGGRGVEPGPRWREWVVTRRIQETADVVTFVLAPADGRPAEPSLPGQYVSVLLTMPDGVRQPRQYSLSRADDGGHRQITVKRAYGGGKPDGEVSNLLHDTVDAGDRLALSLPYGDVVLDTSDRPLVLVSAGVGITPTAGILSHLAATGSARPVTVLHADRHEGAVALRRQVLADAAALPGSTVHLWYEDGARTTDRVDGVHAGYLDLAAVELPGDPVVHLCGPVVFMEAARGALLDLGVPARDIRYEVFGPDLWQADVDDTAPSSAVEPGTVTRRERTAPTRDGLPTH